MPDVAADDLRSLLRDLWEWRDANAADVRGGVLPECWQRLCVLARLDPEDPYRELPPGPRGEVLADVCATCHGSGVAYYDQETGEAADHPID